LARRAGGGPRPRRRGRRGAGGRHRRGRGAALRPARDSGPRLGRRAAQRRGGAVLERRGWERGGPSDGRGAAARRAAPRPGGGGGGVSQFLGRPGPRVRAALSAERPVPRAAADAAALVEAALREDGVDVRLGASVDAEELRGYERVLVATGRRANLDGLEPL